jgi:hypothetical protein
MDFDADASLTLTALIVVPIVLVEEELGFEGKKGRDYTASWTWDVPEDFPQVNSRVTATLKGAGEVLMRMQLDVEVRK